MKIKVTPEQSEFIQKYWFSQGYVWEDNSKTVKNVDSSYILTSSGKIKFSDTSVSFNDDTITILASTYIEKILIDTMRGNEKTWKTVISNKEESKKIQDAFIRLGASWDDDVIRIKHINASYLCLKNNIFDYNYDELSFFLNESVGIPAYILIEYARQAIEKIGKNNYISDKVIASANEYIYDNSITNCNATTSATTIRNTYITDNLSSTNVHIRPITTFIGSEYITKNNITKGMKNVAKVADIVSSTLDANKQAVTTVVEITIGKATIKSARKLIKPKLPMFLKGYADSPIFDVIIANMLQIAVETRFKDNEKLRKLSKATMNAAALTIAEHFDIDGMIDDFINSITFPKGVKLEDIED
jgi:hypothetical protein